MLTVAIVAGISAVAAYLIASRLYGGSLPDAVATTWLIFYALMIGPMLGAGIVGEMKPAVVVAANLFLCCLLLGFRSKLPALIPTRPQRFNASPFELLLITGLTIGIGLQLHHWVVLCLDENSTGTFIDVIVFEIPTIVDFIRTNTLWTFNQEFSYYPANYGLLLAWGMMLAKNYGQNPLVQLSALFGLLGYAAAITNLVLERRPSAHRAIASLAVILVFVGMRVHKTTIGWVGKNDLFVAFCGLASFFHLMRYWTSAGPRPNGHIALAGLALGLMIGTKLSAAYWAALMGVGHGALLLRNAHLDLRRWVRTVSVHLLQVVIPVLFFGGVWVLRVFYGYEFTPSDGEFVEFARDSTILNLYWVPVVADATPRWLGYWVLAAVGGLLVIAPGKRLPWIARLLGVVAAAIAFLAANVFNYTYLGPLAVSLTIAFLPLLGRWLSPELVSGRLVAASCAATLSLMLFTIMPFSAYTGSHANLVDPPYVHIFYRYTLFSFPLVLVILVALSSELIFHWEPRSFLFESRRLFSWAEGERGSPLRQALLAGVVVMTCVLVRGMTYERLDSAEQWENFQSAFDEPTSIYSWARNNIRNSSLLVVNLPAWHFYGEEIGDNRVFSGRYPWSDAKSFDRTAAEQLIDQQRIEHVLFGLYFHGNQPSPETLSHIAEMRDEYAVLFEDEQAIVFATMHHRPRPPSRSIDYDFSTLASENLRMRGFRGIEHRKDLSLRRTNSTIFRVRARIEQGQDVSVSFRIERGVPPVTVETLRLFANDIELALREARSGDGGHVFEARVPEALLRSGNPDLELRFEVDKEEDGLEAGEPGDVGLLFDRLRIEPASAAAS